jgi:ubiquinone/menaquinone biosynthesis C-methylase UbiE
MPSLEEVRNFWEQHPLCAYEIQFEPGTPEFFQAHDRLKREHTDRFNLPLWEFDARPGQSVLDVGCGPGWLVQEYSRGRASVVGLDLTRRAVELTRKRLAYQALAARLLQANAECLPFESNAFDLVSCSGVLHHTPDTRRAVEEIHRVLKPGGKAIVSLYFRSLFFQPLVWPFTRILLRKLYLRTGFRQESRQLSKVEDFVRLYDGDHNPLGKVYSSRQVRELFSRFRRVRCETHYFPRRFFEPYLSIDSVPLLKLLDRIMGTLIFAVADK